MDQSHLPLVRSPLRTSELVFRLSETKSTARPKTVVQRHKMGGPDLDPGPRIPCQTRVETGER